jgi:hypothetical protein
MLIPLWLSTHVAQALHAGHEASAQVTQLQHTYVSTTSITIILAFVSNSIVSRAVSIKCASPRTQCTSLLHVKQVAAVVQTALIGVSAHLRPQH